MINGPGQPERDAVDLDEFGFDDERWLSVLRSGRENLLGRLGRYDLLCEVGRGGQGVVYRGRQPGTGRDVALKRLVAGALATEDARKRFEREVEAASALRHAGVVTVYGIESVDGEPVLAMEWVDGVPITRWAACDGGRSVDAILRVFVLTCEAVAHAHRHGVIHRDLKPSNILVDRDDRPRVLDFGMAKLSRSDGAETTAITGSEFAGTIAYASPEQIGLGAAAVDTRTDVYSLGLVLYELLAQRPPLPRNAPLEALVDAILRVDPPPPSKLNPDAPRELDHVVSAAIAKDRDRRYASVEALAADVRRFLEGEAVEAHPPSRWYRARKLVARHRLASALVAIIAILMIAFVAMTLRQAAKLELERDAALAARARETAARELADRRREEMKAMADFLMEDIIGSVDPQRGGRDSTIGEAVDRAAASVGGRFAGRPAPEAAVRTSLGDAFDKLARYPEAEREHRRATELRRGIPAYDGITLANTMLRLSRALVPQGKHDEARTLLLEARGILSAFGPEGDEHLAVAVDELAQLVAMQGKFPEAVDLFRESLEIFQRIKGGPDSLAAITSRSNLGCALLYLKRWGEARVELTAALESYRRSGRTGESEYLLSHLGWVEVQDGRIDEGVNLLRRSVALYEVRYGSEHPETGSQLSLLATALVKAKKLEEAEEISRRAVAIHRAASGAPRRQLASSIAGLAGVTLALGKRTEALELMAEAVAMWTAIGCKDEAASSAAALDAVRRTADSQPASRLIR